MKTKLLKFILPVLISIIHICTCIGQNDDLEALLNAEMDDVTHYVTGTFKASRVIHGHSIEQMPKGGLDFRVAHRFGQFDQGFYELFGLDYASSYFSLEYGLLDNLMIGAGRATYKKTWNGFAKVKILRQSEGGKNIPLSIGWCSNMAVNGMKFMDEEKQKDFSSRLSYTHQLLIARKFGPKLSLQLTPSLVHRNLVTTKEQNNDLIACGLGGRYLFTKRTALVFDYYYVYGLEPDGIYNYYHPLAIGVDIQVSGHVFQLHVTNSEAMLENGFIGETTADFFGGDIRFGFNIATVF